MSEKKKPVDRLLELGKAVSEAMKKSARIQPVTYIPPSTSPTTAPRPLKELRRGRR